MSTNLTMLQSTAVIDRQFKGEIASTMDKLTTRALQAQVEAAVGLLLFLQFPRALNLRRLVRSMCVTAGV